GVVGLPVALLTGVALALPGQALVFRGVPNELLELFREPIEDAAVETVLLKREIDRLVHCLGDGDALHCRANARAVCVGLCSIGMRNGECCWHTKEIADARAAWSNILIVELPPAPRVQVLPHRRLFVRRPGVALVDRERLACLLAFRLQFRRKFE